MDKKVANKRVFFGLSFTLPEKNKIDQWRQHQLPRLGREVPLANLHITLYFLGNCRPEQLDEFVCFADTLSCPAFSLTFDHYGYWPKPKVFWLGCSQVPEELLALVDRFTQMAAKQGIRSHHPSYHPHVTLFRKVQDPGPLLAAAPCFSKEFHTFTLFESREAKLGVNYHQLTDWHLG